MKKLFLMTALILSATVGSAAAQKTTGSTVSAPAAVTTNRAVTLIAAHYIITKSQSFAEYSGFQRREVCEWMVDRYFQYSDGSTSSPQFWSNAWSYGSWGNIVTGGGSCPLPAGYNSMWF